MSKLEVRAASSPVNSTSAERGVQADLERNEGAADIDRDDDDTAAVARAVSYQLADQTRYESNRRIFAIFLSLALPIACFFLEQSIVSTAQPAIIAELGQPEDAAYAGPTCIAHAAAGSPQRTR